jgi:hypothetical protein
LNLPCDLVGGIVNGCPGDFEERHPSTISSQGKRAVTVAPRFQAGPIAALSFLRYSKSAMLETRRLENARGDRAR